MNAENVADKLRAMRGMLRAYWESIDFDHTEQALGVPVPEKGKAAPEGATFVDLVPKERWSLAGPPLLEAMLARESRRKYAPSALSLEELGKGLYRYLPDSHRLCLQEAHREGMEAEFDAGHLCQNLYLACEAVGAGACAIGAYDQALADAFFGADGDEEFAIYLATVGKLK